MAGVAARWGWVWGRMCYSPAGTLSEEARDLVHRRRELGAFGEGLDVDANGGRGGPDSAPELELGLVLR